MLIYSPLLIQLDSPLCEHITSHWEAARSDVRYSIVRLLGYRTRHVSFSLSPVEDVYEIQVPRLQVGTGTFIKPTKAADSEEEDKRVLRSEIKAWWQAVTEHLDKLVSDFIFLKEATLMSCEGGIPGSKHAEW
jgi:1-phosphatidylinositol-3-phosphate 5-kinase